MFLHFKTLTRLVVWICVIVHVRVCYWNLFTLFCVLMTRSHQRYCFKTFCFQSLSFKSCSFTWMFHFWSCNAHYTVHVYVRDVLLSYLWDWAAWLLFVSVCKKHDIVFNVMDWTQEVSALDQRLIWSHFYLNLLFQGLAVCSTLFIPALIVQPWDRLLNSMHDVKFIILWQIKL